MNTFIKYVIRVTGALCILGALAIMFFTPWVRVENVKRTDIRNFREDRLQEIAITRSTMLRLIEEDRFKEDLKDNDVPCQKADIKKRTKKAEELTKNLLDDTISLKEMFVTSAAMPGIVRDAHNLLDTTFCAKIVFNDTLDYNIRSMEEVVGNVKTNNYVFYCILIFLILLALLGIAAAVLNVIHKAGWVKYLFAIYVLIFTIAFFVGMPLLTDFLQNSDLPKQVEDINIRTTIMPVLATLLSIVPIVLNIVFKKKEQPA